MIRQDTAQQRGPMKTREMKRPPEKGWHLGNTKAKQVYDSVTRVKEDLFAKFWDSKRISINSHIPITNQRRLGD